MQCVEPPPYTVGSMNEDQTLVRISIRQMISGLTSEEDRVMVLLYFQLEEPTDYKGAWPPTFASVAEYIGRRFGEGPLAESTIRYRMRVLLTRWKPLAELTFRG